MKANSRCKQSALRVCFSNHGFTSAVGLREISIGSEYGFRPTYMNAKWNPKCESELIDFLKEVLFNEMLGLD